MTIIRSFEATCDKCNATTSFGLKLAKELRARLRSEGWVVRKGSHVCNTCKNPK